MRIKIETNFATPIVLITKTGNKEAVLKNRSLYTDRQTDRQAYS
jgi:hypothetical protein